MTSPESPGSQPQALARASADALGLKPFSLPELRELAQTVPFEWGYVGVAVLSAQLWEIWTDGRSQLALMREIHGNVPIVERYEGFLTEWPSGVLLSQQQLYAVQRLLIQEARDAPFDT